MSLISHYSVVGRPLAVRRTAAVLGKGTQARTWSGQRVRWANGEWVHSPTPPRSQAELNALYVRDVFARKKCCKRPLLADLDARKFQ